MYWIIGILVTFMALMCFQNLKAPVLGVEDGQFKPLAGKPNGVSTQTEDKSKRVEPISFSDDPDSVMKTLETIVAKMSGATLKVQTGNYLYAVFTSSLLHFHDDVEIYVDKENSLIHFRSASRAGYSDMGVNRKRYQSFAQRFEKALIEKK